MAVRAHGTLFQIGDGGDPEVFTTIAEVLDIEDAGSSFEVEAFRGDGDGFPAVVPSETQPGEIEFDINYTRASSQVALRDAHLDQSPRSLRLVFPTSPAETVTFRGYITGFAFSAPVEGIMRASVTITMASAMVFA